MSDLWQPGPMNPLQQAQDAAATGAVAGAVARSAAADEVTGLPALSTSLATVRVQRRLAYPLAFYPWMVVVDGEVTDWLFLGEHVVFQVHPGFHRIEVLDRGRKPGAPLDFEAGAGEAIHIGCWLEGSNLSPKLVVGRRPEPGRVVGRRPGDIPAGPPGPPPPPPPPPATVPPPPIQDQL